MKFKLTCLLILIHFIAFSQNKVILKTEDSKTFKGTVASFPITLFIENKEIIDCDIDNRYINGWYYYDKYKIKIPLSGYINDCDMKLYYYGKNHLTISKRIVENIAHSSIDSTYESYNPDEVLYFDNCASSDEKNNNWKGTFKNKNKISPIILDSDNSSFGEKYELFKLPNSKIIDLKKIFTGYGGNEFYSITEDKNENRLLFYFESISNHNACGRCGASEGEKGYRIIYFDKNWKIKKNNEYLIESCLENIYDTKIIKKSNSLIKYLIKESEGKSSTYLIVNKSTSQISK